MTVLVPFAQEVAHRLGGAVPLSERESVSLFADLPVPLQQAVARGDIDLDTLLERVTAPATGELCPACGAHEVPTSGLGARLGLCGPCAHRRMADAYDETLIDLLAVREANAKKKQVQRDRDELFPDRPKRSDRPPVVSELHADDYGMVTSPAPTNVRRTHRRCRVCTHWFEPLDRNDKECPRCRKAISATRLNRKEQDR